MGGLNNTIQLLFLVLFFVLLAGTLSAQENENTPDRPAENSLKVLATVFAEIFDSKERSPLHLRFATREVRIDVPSFVRALDQLGERVSRGQINSFFASRLPIDPQGRRCAETKVCDWNAPPYRLKASDVWEELGPPGRYSLIVTMEWGRQWEEGRSMARDADGKIVGVGYLMRFEIDTTQPEWTVTFTGFI